jgi:P pilus assembly chaperone PapD
MRSKSNRKHVWAAIFAVVFFGAAVSGPGQVFFGISPIRVEHEGKPGENLTDIFYVRNNATAPIRLKVYTENWRLQEDGVPVFIGTQAVPYSCREWVKVNPQDFRLLPNEVKSVRYTIAIPPEASSAGYHASVSFESVPDISAEKKESRMIFTGKIAAAVYVKVGKVEPVAQVLDLKFLKDKGASYAVLVLKNQGKTHFRTQGGLEIYDASGKKTLQAEIPNEVVLPESQREVRCPLPKALPAGAYKAVCRLDIGRAELLGFEKEWLIKDEK